jgi:chemotaxis protein MotA
MDLTTVLGILIGVLALAGGFLLEDGELGGLLVYTAAIIVFGGTFGAVIVSFPRKQLKQIPRALLLAFREPNRDPYKRIDELVDMAYVARREGVLALEDYAQNHPNPFLRDALQMVVDGTDPELAREILEVEIDAKEKELHGYARIFEAAGGYAPTMGIIGTVMGLIHVLSSMENPAELAGAIAVAFTATLYGVASANVIYLPIASKIKARAEEETAELELLVEGVLSVQAGENPQLIRKKLMSFVSADPAFGRREERTDDGKKE